MTLQVEFSYVIGLTMTIIGAFWGLARMLMAQSRAQIDMQFETMREAMTKQDDISRRIERDLMDMKAELPRDYVRRDDHNRVIASVHVSIDNLRLTIERFMLERGSK